MGTWDPERPSPVLRLATWNCRGAVDAKRGMFDRLGADVIVVPECSRRPRWSEELGVSFEWSGEVQSKGLGVFGMNGWRVARIDDARSFPWLLPVAVIDPSDDVVATLLAIWTVERPGSPRYHGQVAMAIAAWEREIEEGRVILAGDFNCSAQTVSTSGHLENVQRLTRAGAASAYHAHTGSAHGEERAMTLRWVGPGSREHWYHCDFVLLSAALAHRVVDVQVGDPAEWLGPGRSDHCPVTVELVTQPLARPGTPG